MFNIYTYNIQKLKLQSYRGVCHLKGSAGDNRLWKTSMHEAAGATKQRQISTQVWAGEWCHLSEPHLQSAAILSAPLPAPLHLWKCILHHEGSPKSSYMIGTRHGVCNQPRTRLRGPSPPHMIGTKSPTQLLEQDCELTEPCLMAALLWALCQYSSHSPPPCSCFSLALIF